MNNREKVQFFERVAELRTMQEIEQQLKEQPIFEDELSTIGYDIIKKNTDTIKDLRDRGLIIRRPYPTIEEFVDQAKGYVVRRSSVFQMEKSEYKLLRTSGVLFSQGNKGFVETYDDLEDGQVPLHFDWQVKGHNGKYTTSYTGGSDMFEVAREVLDEVESEARASEIRAVQLSYQKARQEIDFLLQNLDAIKSGSVNTQYHGSISR